MSDVVTGGVAAVAIGACVAAFGAAVAAGYAAYRGLTWLSEQAKREMEKLEKQLAEPLSHATTKQARAHFEKQFALFKAEAAKSPLLKDHAGSVARLLALRQSPLGLALGKEEWQKVLQPATSTGFLRDLLGRAATRLTTANAAYVSRSVAEVAKEVGFGRERLNRQENGKRTIVMEDGEGRALVAEVIESDAGAGINLDLTGFGDGSCHPVMDRVLGGLAKKDIRIEGLKRRSHYRREGVLPEAVKFSGQKVKEAKRSYPDSERREAEERRKRQFHGREKVQIRQEKVR